MALRLTCPNCGARPHTEFWFGGEVEARAEGPKPDSGGGSRDAALEADFARVWLRQNSCGIQHERWFHHAGCRRWHTAVRDTLTNEVHGRA
jgi:heterotetrameric sarcosine oxidase delta subunit